MMNICKICQSWMLAHDNLRGWKKCINCGFCAMTNPLISLDNYLTASGKYPDRKDHKELNEELLKNADTLLQKVNAFLYELGIKEVQVSSGFRPSEANSSTSNASKKSAHMECKAIDIMDDKQQSLCKKIQKNPDLLTKHGLWMEDSSSTIGKNSNWCHLDIKDRKDRPIRIFKP